MEKTTNPKKIVLKAPKSAAPKRQRFTFSQVRPSDIVDVWALYKQSLDQAPPNYPMVSEEPEKFIQSQVFNMISQQNFMGVVAKLGRKPVAQMNGFFSIRPYGAPRQFFQFWLFWVDPEFRGSDLGKQLFREMSVRIKDAGVFNFESIIDPAMVPVMEKVYGGPLSVVSHRIVGKVKVD